MFVCLPAIEVATKIDSDERSGRAEIVHVSCRVTSHITYVADLHEKETMMWIATLCLKMLTRFYGASDVNKAMFFLTCSRPHTYTHTH